MYRKLIKLLISLILIIICVIFLPNISVNGENNINDAKNYCDATIEQNFSENEIIIVLNKEISRNLDIDISFDNINYEKLEDLTSSYDTIEEMNENFRRIYKITLSNSSKQNVLNTIKKIEEHDYIYSAEPNYFDQVQIVPNDYSAISQYAVNMMELNKAWDFTTGTNGIKVGIIDTGIDGNHPDLQANINIELSRCFTSDFTNPLEDAVGHGTHVAGIVGAIGDNSIGIPGVNWKVSLISLRVADTNGQMPISNIISAINYANDDNVKIDILNYSGGGYNNSSYVTSREQSIRNYSGLFVCSSGNNENDNDVNSHYPSTHNIPNLVSVGALASDGDRADVTDWGYDLNNNPQGSNYGSNTVQIYAPGDSIYSTIPNNQYGYKSGTSMSSPQVAGVAALLLSINPNLTSIELKTAILDSAETITISIPGGSTQNVRKLNASNAVKYVLRNYTTDITNLDYDSKSITRNILSSSDYFYEKNYFVKLLVTNSYEYDFSISSAVALKVTLYDSNFNEISIYPTTTSNKNIEYSKYLTYGTYYLRTNSVNPIGTNRVFITITGEPHNHIYDQHYCIKCGLYTASHDYDRNYRWVDYYNHIATCGCGANASLPHVVSSDSFGFGQLYATCMLCGGDAEMGFNGMGFNSTLINKVSTNGSFILQNGVIVLEDKDLEAFLNGTLVFNNRNDFPVVS